MTNVIQKELKSFYVMSIKVLFSSPNSAIFASRKTDWNGGEESVNEHVKGSGNFLFGFID